MFLKYQLTVVIILSVFLTSNAVAEEKGNVWLPEAVKFDWVQLTSGEWLKGEIKSMYNERLEFDSDKLDLLSIKWEDIKYLRSHGPANVNFENYESVTGILTVSDEQITVEIGHEKNNYKRSEIISFAPAGDKEINLWAIEFTLALNLKEGNTRQIDYSSILSAKRRTAKTRFLLDYIGNISKTDAVTGSLEETSNNNRLTIELNKYVTRNFYYTPIYTEYYSDSFQNIDERITLGVGLGYTIVNTDRIEGDVSGGPAFLTTKYQSVQPGEDIRVSTGAMILGTNFDIEVTNNLDFIFKYNLKVASEESGGYTHHIIATLKSELTRRLDLDISAIWDRIGSPSEDEFGIVPEQDDYRLLIGITYKY